MALLDGVTPDVYLPILRGRRGELKALAMLPPAAVPAVLPILEVMPSAAGPTQDAYRFFLELRDRAPRDLVVAVDLGHPPTPPGSADLFCWGDRELERRAFGAGGPGSPTDWVAWATSRHLAHALDAERRPA